MDSVCVCVCVVCVWICIIHMPTWILKIPWEKCPCVCPGIKCLCTCDVRTYFCVQYVVKFSSAHIRVNLARANLYRQIQCIQTIMLWSECLSLSLSLHLRRIRMVAHTYSRPAYLTYTIQVSSPSYILEYGKTWAHSCGACSILADTAEPTCTFQVYLQAQDQVLKAFSCVSVKMPWKNSNTGRHAHKKKYSTAGTSKLVHINTHRHTIPPINLDSTH